MRGIGILVGVLILALSFNTVHAGLITLCNFSTDETPAEDLDTTMEFTLTGNMLTIVVTNLTDGSDNGVDTGYDITAFYFNATDNILDLKLEDPDAGWVLYSWSNITKAGGCGQFDYAIIGGISNNPIIVEGETSQTFTLSITHGGSVVSESDFYTEMSRSPPGDNPMLVAAKFQRGINDDSAYGGTNTPEPTMISLFGLGSIFVFVKRKR
jgi:hypothetical protein